MKDRHELLVDRFLEELDVAVPWGREIRAMCGVKIAETYKKLIELGCDTEDVRESLIAGMRAASARAAYARAAYARSASPAPNWNDERAVADWVAYRPLRLVPVYNVNSTEERHRLAIEDAKAGDFYALEDMIRSGERLSAEARELIADNLGRATKKKPDPRRLTHELSKNPDAERAFVEIEHRLKQGFPQRSVSDIKDRAFALAAEQFEMNQETLRNYVARSERHPRRLSPKPRL
jgi:hypothetical protein